MDKKLELALLEGEGLRTEFKEKISDLDKEIVAFANTSGGTIYIGVADTGKIIGVSITNQLKSQITDIAHNCDPSIPITFHEFHAEKVLAVIVGRGSDKPYRCKEGFYIRNGPSTQKLKRDEIVTLINQTDKLRFDETLNEQFSFPKDFSQDALNEFLKVSGIKTLSSAKDILTSLSVAQEEDHQLKFTNTGVLFFAKEPQRFFPETYITAIKYKSQDRFAILDKKDFMGSPLSQIEQTLSFMLRHMNVEPNFELEGPMLGARRDIYEYSPVAIREAVINAVAHRDYLYDSSHIYVHMFPNYIEIENPGGLYRGLTLEELGKRSVRRNRLIADLLHRAGLIERVGSGFSRMENSLQENSNPPLEVSASNFFNIRFYKRVANPLLQKLSPRQKEIYRIILERGMAQKKEIATQLAVSEDTVIRELKELIHQKLIGKRGIGRATTYYKSA